MTRSRAHAKINLFLHVTGRRSDGYHELDSLAVFASAHDVISVRRRDHCAVATKDITLRVEGAFSAGLEDGDNNLVLRAAESLRDLTPSRPTDPLDITLTKNLPIASGIGGGSADAAAALRAISEVWGCGAPNLAEIAAKIGADVPVCLAQRPARMRGTGAELFPAPALPPFYILLVNPGLAVSTPQIFGLYRDQARPFTQAASLPDGWVTLDAMVDALQETRNDLQPIAELICPEITRVIDVISCQPGCQFARMSGSGATCFGLFSSAKAAEAASLACRAKGWWTDAGPALTSFPNGAQVTGQ